MSVKKVKLLVDAMYIASGGGLVLLNYLLEELSKVEVDLYLLKDRRNTTTYEFLADEKVVTVSPSLLKRHKFFLSHRDFFDVVFTFNNLPPTIKLGTAKVFTYFHQALYLQKGEFGHSFKVNTFLKIKRSIIALFISYVDTYFVQTEYIKNKFSRVFKVHPSSVKVLPFFSDSEVKEISQVEEASLHFIYVSDGNRHKNHNRLLEAWQKVNTVYPSVQLILTISPEKYPVLCNEIERLRSEGLNVVNIGFVPKSELSKLYQDNHFMVYPSLTESFGLGLIEAVQHGCEVIAADLEYVRSVIEPLHTFDPFSTDSMAEAIIKSIEEHPSPVKSKLIVRNKVRDLIRTITTPLQLEKKVTV